ncbi:IucA/IucC family protein [Streptomyces bottropensis]|uniref:IucA/IucC family protein n=1 Tax=Streptomyces bottropensis TaxID=42235 RepID=UPI0037FA28A5
MKPPPAPEARTHDTNNRTPLTPGQPGDEQSPAHVETRFDQAGPGFGQVEPKSDLAALGSGQTTVGFGTAAPGAGPAASAHGQAHRGAAPPVGQRLGQPEPGSGHAEPLPGQAGPTPCRTEPEPWRDEPPPYPVTPVPHQAAPTRTPVPPRDEWLRPAPGETDEARTTEPPDSPLTDPLLHPDPHTAAHAAAIENLLRCWVREHNLTSPHDGTLRIPLPTSATTLLAPVHYWSLSGWHRFGPPRLAGTPESAPPLDAAKLAALLAGEATARGPLRTNTHEPRPTAAHAPTTPPRPPSGPESTDPLTRLDHPHRPSHRSVPVDRPGPLDQPGRSGQRDRLDQLDPLDLIGRVADSTRRVAMFIAERRVGPADGPGRFLAAEQALVLGHPLHPTPKSREGLSELEARLYSPELRGSFPLHWLAIAPSVMSADSAWTERGRAVRAEQLTARLAGPELPLPEGHGALPVHPWQLREIRRRPAVAALFDAGLLRDLGPHGDPWHPTSSVRTVHRHHAPAMLKLSLGLRITNSCRENLRKELHRGVEVHRLLRTGLTAQWQAAHPRFDIVRDPAWLGVTAPDGGPLPGLDVLVRHNPFGPADDVACVAGLVSPRPYAHAESRAAHRADRRSTQDERAEGHQPQYPVSTLRQGPDAASETHLMVGSRLADVVTRLAGRTGRPRGAVAVEWFLRYLEQVVRPVLWLDGEAGIALEAHHQNTLVLLDPDGWPIGGRYRDNQGYYFRESRRADLAARLPGIGERSDTFVSDEVADERFAYYLGINNVLGLIGAFGSQRLGDERLLLAAFRRFLSHAATGPARMNTTLPAQLLDSPVLRCKANLLTRLHGLDELVGPVDSQSVYVTITNPLHR